MRTLPESWTKLQLKEVSEIITGSTPSTKNPEYYGGDIPFIKPGDLDTQKPLIQATQYLSTEGAKKSRLVRKGASLVSCIGNLGKVGYAGKVVATNQQINSVEFDKNLVDDRFGFYQLKTLKNWMKQEASATTISILNKSKFSEAPILLAPLKEQRRIADKLDTTLARVDALNDRLARITPLFKRFRQSVLAAATSGRLTEDLRSSANLSAWVKVPTETVSDFQSGFAFKSEIFKSQGDYQILKLANVKQNNLNLSAAPAFVDKKDVLDCLKFAPNVGDILISMTGTKYKKDYGFACLIKKEIKCLVNQRVGRFIPDMGKIIPYYFLLSLMSEEFREQFFEGETGGVNQGNVGAKHIKSCTINLPSLAEQTEIVRRVETLFAFADRLEARLQSAQTAAERLTPALLAKAFRGELVPQDPNDEPAAELLRRLREARATEAPAKPKRGRKAAAA